MIDIIQTIESYKGQRDYQYLARINELYRCLKMCKPHQFDYDWRDTMIRNKGYIDYYQKDGSALSYLYFLFRFKMEMKDCDYLGAMGELEDMIRIGIDVLREDIYYATVNTIEGELCHIEKNPSLKD